MAFICDFGLLEKPIIGKPFIARCDVTIQPSDITIPLRLMLGQIHRTDLTTIEGLIHIKTFIPLDATDVMDGTRWQLWENVRKENAQLGYYNSPIALIDFHTNDSEQSITSSVVIQQEAIDRVKEGVGFEVESAILPGRSSIPLSSTACIEYVTLFSFSSS